MKITINQLSLVCKKEIIDIPFSKNITYFYGKMGAGKSTILQLIDFCLGNELVETPALQQEFIGAQLGLNLGDYSVLINRDKGTNQVHVEWESNSTKEKINVLVPINSDKNTKSIIPNTDITRLSDLLFYLGGYNPPRVRKSKKREDTELIRLSFRDLMWYCYLNQDEIDSSFFHLEREAHNFKKLKSRDVMRLILGYHQENVAQLESELFDIRQKKTNLSGTAKQIGVFLEDNNIGNAESINEEIKKLDEELKKIMLQLDNIDASLKENYQHPVDELKNEARSYAIILDELNSSIHDIEMQIAQRKRLLGEFAAANLKVSRSLEARKTLLDVSFSSCPECGNDIKERIKKTNECSLCLQPYEQNTENNNNNISVLKTDLTSRYNELTDSIERLNYQKDNMIKKLSILEREKVILDEKIQEVQKDYDSIFLAKAKGLERKVGELKSEKESYKKLLPLTKKVTELQNEADELTVDEERLKRNLNEARSKAEEDTTNLDKLKEYFLDNLINVGLPGITKSDIVSISTKDFIPRVHTSNKDDLFETEFSNLGSGGKKTIFKCCFILAIHRLAAERNVPLPSLLMIDTPMKNISERENEDIFKGFYNFLYELFEKELIQTQLILVDKEFFSPPKTVNHLIIHSKHMTPDDPKYPPLIRYYKGH